MKRIVKGRVVRDDTWPICYARHSKAVVPKEHHLHEECGVFGVFSEECADVASLAYYGLFALMWHLLPITGFLPCSTVVRRVQASWSMMMAFLLPTVMKGL